jgi:hypothetical protein
VAVLEHRVRSIEIRADAIVYMDHIVMERMPIRLDDEFAYPCSFNHSSVMRGNGMVMNEEVMNDLKNLGQLTRPLARSLIPFVSIATATL